MVNTRLDDGRTKTYVNEDVAAKLRLKGAVEQFEVNVLNGHSETLETVSVQMELESLNGSTKFKINAYAVNGVTGNRVINWKPLTKRCKHLRHKPFPNTEPRPVMYILIRIDYAVLHCSLEEMRKDLGDPTVEQTPLTWICIGSINLHNQYQIKQVLRD